MTLSFKFTVSGALARDEPLLWDVPYVRYWVCATVFDISGCNFRNMQFLQCTAEGHNQTKVSFTCCYNAFTFKHLIFGILSPRAMVFLKAALQRGLPNS